MNKVSGLSLTVPYEIHMNKPLVPVSKFTNKFSSYEIHINPLVPI